jgi:hypothetical protein
MGYDKMVTEVKMMTIEVFALVDQLRGLSASSEESHPTILEPVSEATIV